MGDKKRADYYDGPAHDYLGYWAGRDYEHAAEEVALRRLLGAGGSATRWTSAGDTAG